MKSEFIAHVKQTPGGKWIKQTLENHLTSVAKLAGEFTSEFGNKDWGELLGYWHDLGKFLPAWQAYLLRNSGCDPDAHIEGDNNRPNHSTAGAVLAIDKLSKVLDKASKLLAYGIAGHHAGLPDWYAPFPSIVVAPRVGAWIETFRKLFRRRSCVTTI